MVRKLRAVNRLSLNILLRKVGTLFQWGGTLPCGWQPLQWLTIFPLWTLLQIGVLFVKGITCLFFGLSGVMMAKSVSCLNRFISSSNGFNLVNSRLLVVRKRSLQTHVTPNGRTSKTNSHSLFLYRKYCSLKFVQPLFLQHKCCVSKSHHRLTAATSATTKEHTLLTNWPFLGNCFISYFAHKPASILGLLTFFFINGC